MSLQLPKEDFVPRSKKAFAIPIVAPSEDTKSAATPDTPSASKQSKVNANGAKTLCRNVIIHGYCKFEKEGCTFSHESNDPIQKTNQEISKGKSPSPPSTRATSGVTTSSSAPNVHAPVFTPRAVLEQGNASLMPAPSGEKTQPFDTELSYHEGSNGINSHFSQLDLTPKKFFSPPVFHPQAPRPMQMFMPPNRTPREDPYSMNQSAVEREPLKYHLYAPSPSHVSRLEPPRRTIHSLFLPNNLREELTKKNEAIMATVPANKYNLPEEVDNYHSLFPLGDEYNMKPSIASKAYKAICANDGKTYNLIRIEGIQLNDAKVMMEAVKKWRAVQHSAIVSIREFFTTRAFGDSSLVFVFDYHPCAVTLDKLIDSKRSANELWSYITQITSALKAIHSAGFAVYGLNTSEVLVTSKNRLRLNGVCVRDVLQFESRTNHTSMQNLQSQKDDLISFGNLIKQFGSQEPSIMYLVECLQQKNVDSIDEVIAYIGPHILQDFDSSQCANDVLELELSRELENGRLVRLMSKMGFINERPEFAKDQRWSETGDRYLISLFRDYVFHQVDERGLPVVDMAHVLTCLNKLDAGVDEKIMLTSRDENSCLVVSYKEIKNCIASAFNELRSGQK